MQEGREGVRGGGREGRGEGGEGNLEARRLGLGGGVEQGARSVQRPAQQEQLVSALRDNGGGRLSRSPRGLGAESSEETSQTSTRSAARLIRLILITHRICTELVVSVC